MMSGNKPYGPAPEEAAAYERLEAVPCNHVVPENERNTAEELATTDPHIVGDAVLALAVRGFMRLYGDQKGVLHPPESSATTKQSVREQLDQFSDVIQRMFIITHDPNDAVKRSEAWSAARGALEYDGEILRKPRAVQKAFEDAMTWRVGQPSHSVARWGGNCEYWQGVTWTAEAMAHNRVTQPDWRRV